MGIFSRSGSSTPPPDYDTDICEGCGGTIIVDKQGRGNCTRCERLSNEH